MLLPLQHPQQRTGVPGQRIVQGLPRLGKRDRVGRAHRPRRAVGHRRARPAPPDPGITTTACYSGSGRSGSHAPSALARSAIARAAGISGQRWELISRLLHDDTLDLTDRAAGCLLLLFGQHLSRTAVMTTSQIITRHDGVHLRFGKHEVPVPSSLGHSERSAPSTPAVPRGCASRIFTASMAFAVITAARHCLVP